MKTHDNRLKIITKNEYKKALAMVKQNGHTIKDVPNHLLSVEICLAAVNCGTALESVPEQFQTPDLFIRAVSRDSKALCFVPKEFRTAELCLYALTRVTSTGIGIFIPKHLQSIKKEDYEETLLRGKTIEELLTHSHPWFRAQGEKLLEKRETE
jgi:hypothetical protein